MKRFEPRPSTSFVTSWLAPIEIEMSRMMAVDPIVTPSVVSVERSLFATTASSET